MWERYVEKGREFNSGKRELKNSGVRIMRMHYAHLTLSMTTINQRLFKDYIFCGLFLSFLWVSLVSVFFMAIPNDFGNKHTIKQVIVISMKETNNGFSFI